MKIILFQDVLSLGDEGDIKTVKDGYARNFLFPKKLAVPFNAHYEHMFEQKKAKIEAKRTQKKQMALSLKEKLHGQELEFLMPAGENGKLFGALTSAMIAERFLTDGIEIEKRQVSIPGNAIKALGTYEVKIRVMERETAAVKVTVKPQA